MKNVALWGAQINSLTSFVWMQKAGGIRVCQTTQQHPEKASSKTDI